MDRYVVQVVSAKRRGNYGEYRTTRVLEIDLAKAFAWELQGQPIPKVIPRVNHPLVKAVKYESLQDNVDRTCNSAHAVAFKEAVQYCKELNERNDHD